MASVEYTQTIQNINPLKNEVKPEKKSFVYVNQFQAITNYFRYATIVKIISLGGDPNAKIKKYKRQDQNIDETLDALSLYCEAGEIYNPEIIKGYHPER